MSMDSTVCITVNDSVARGNNLEFFIKTGSMEPPIVCFANNVGFPNPRQIYARPFKNEAIHYEGVHVTIEFDGPAQGTELAINLAQPYMRGDYSVVPLD